MPLIPKTRRQEDHYRHQGKNREPGNARLSSRQDDKRNQERPGCRADIPANLEDGLGQSVLTARGQPREPGGFRVKYGRAHADNARRQEHHVKAGSHRKQYETHEGKADPDGQREWLGTMICIRSRPRLQQRCRQLIGQCNETYLAEVQVEQRFEHRVGRRQEGLHRVVQQVTDPDGSQDEVNGLLLFGNCRF